MPRLKAPLFSVAASGSVGQGITYQDAPSAPRVIARSSGPRTNTVRQLNHRWLYALGVAQWQGFSAAQRAPYIAAAAGNPITPMAAWLRTWLNTTPNLSLAIPFNEATGLFAQDISPAPAGLTGTGTLWATIGGRPAISTNGTSSFMVDAADAKLDFTTSPFSILSVVTFAAVPGNGAWLSRRPSVSAGWEVGPRTGATELIVDTYAVGPDFQTRATLAGPPGIPSVIGITRNGTSVRIYQNGVDVTTVAGVHGAIASAATTLHVGARVGGTTLFSAETTQWLAIFNRALSPQEQLAAGVYFRPWLTLS
jgi:hypothetical protein